MAPSVPSVRQKTLGICGMAQTRVPSGDSTAAPSLTTQQMRTLTRGVCVPQRIVIEYELHYNNVRLNSAVGYITPQDMLTGRQQEVHAERDRKLEAARKQRQIRLQQAALRE